MTSIVPRENFIAICVSGQHMIKPKWILVILLKRSLPVWKSPRKTLQRNAKRQMMKGRHYMWMDYLPVTFNHAVVHSFFVALIVC